MSNFTYTTGIPATNNNPSNDQPNMQTNNDNNALIWDVDHVGFNAANGGTHDQVTFSSKNTPGAQTDPVSTLYTGSGTASSVAEVSYRNQNGTFLMSGIKAFALCSSSGITNSQSSNVTSVVRNSDGNYTITLTAGAVASSSFIVIVSCDSAPAAGGSLYPNYTITGTGTFNLLFYISRTVTTDPASFSFIVMQK
jgi:hypothetical protein